MWRRMCSDCQSRFDGRGNMTSETVNVADWIGREETHEDFVARGPFKRLSRPVGRSEGSEGAHIPPVGHWLCLTPDSPQAPLGAGGHPQRGGLIPPPPLPMRMAAGSRLTFHAAIPFGVD